MITPQVGAEGIRKALAILRQSEDTVVKDLRGELRSKIGPLAKQTADAVPVRPPLSGMGNNSPTGWTTVRASVAVTPGRSRKTGNHLVSIRVTPRGKQRGVYIGELAGSRSGGSQARGRRLINVLNSRFPMKGAGGRFAYTKFRMLRPDAVRIAIGIVNRTVQKLDKKLGI
jgi:hypothetical protein